MGTKWKAKKIRTLRGYRALGRYLETILPDFIGEIPKSEIYGLPRGKYSYSQKAHVEGEIDDKGRLTRSIIKVKVAHKKYEIYEITDYDNEAFGTYFND